jgi:alcohol dehydrogenase
LGGWVSVPCWPPCSGAREVVAFDLNESKLALARELGATATINAGDPDAAEQVRALTRGGVDYAFEMAGAIVCSL